MDIVSEKEGAVPSTVVGTITSTSNNPSPSLSLPQQSQVPVTAEQVPIVSVAEVVAVEVDAVETVQVQAPSDLRAGYHLNVNVDGRSLCVEVPAGGVRAGHNFQAIVVFANENRRRPSGIDHVPIGAWRDDLLDCCKFGICHAVLCMGLWAAPVLLGQVMTRLNLNACAENQMRNPSKCSAFHVMLGLFALSMLASVVLGQIIESYCRDGGDCISSENAEPSWLIGIRFSRVGLSFFYYVFIIIVAIRARAYVRRRYKIRPRYCGECEDICCVLWCYPCMACQLSRHTVDFETNRAHCCTKNGLQREATLPV